MNRTVKYQGAFSRIMGFAGKRFLFSPAPSIFFCSRSNFRAITRLETLDTQANNRNFLSCMRKIRHAIRKQLVRQIFVSFAGINLRKLIANNSYRAFVLFFCFARLVLSILAAKFPRIVF